MPRYVEEFVVLETTYGIEKSGKKFQLWAGGCGIGSSDTIDGARSLLYEYIRSRTRAQVHGLSDRLSTARLALELIGDDPFYLARFMQCPEE